jgi:hypothetical protein
MDSGKENKKAIISFDLAESVCSFKSGGDFSPPNGIKPTNVHRSFHLELCQPAYKDLAFPQPHMYWTLCVPVDAQILNVDCFSLKFVRKVRTIAED